MFLHIIEDPLIQTGDVSRRQYADPRDKKNYKFPQLRLTDLKTAEVTGKTENTTTEAWKVAKIFCERICQLVNIISI